MKNYLILVSLVFILIPFSSALNFDSTIYGLNEEMPDIDYGGNYSINVNNSEYLRGLTPQQVADLYVETDPFFISWLNSPYFNTNVDMNDNSISNINSLNVSGIIRFTNTSSFIMYDTDGEAHLVDADLERFDEIRANTFTTPLDINTIHNATGDFINVSTTDGNNIAVIISNGTSAISERFDYSTIILPLTPGTNSTPLKNNVYVNIVGDTFTWQVSTTEPVGQHAMAARVNLGEDGNVYTAALREDGVNGIIKRLQRRFRKEGLLYLSGLDYNATANYLGINNGSYLSGVYDLTTNFINSNDGIFLINSTSGYEQYTGLANLITNARYSDGNSFGSNKYVNIILGITPYDGTGRIYAVIQSKPTNEYTSIIDAYADNDNTLKVYPSDDFTRLNFIPVVRMIFNTNSYEAQILPNGYYAEDYRGGIAGGVSSGGGLSEADPIWTADKLNYWRNDGSSVATGNWNISNYSFTAGNITGNYGNFYGVNSTGYQEAAKDVFTIIGGNSSDGNGSNIYIASGISIDNNSDGIKGPNGKIIIQGSINNIPYMQKIEGSDFTVASKNCGSILGSIYPNEDIIPIPVPSFTNGWSNNRPYYLIMTSGNLTGIKSHIDAVYPIFGDYITISTEHCQSISINDSGYIVLIEETINSTINGDFKVYDTLVAGDIISEGGLSWDGIINNNISFPFFFNSPDNVYGLIMGGSGNSFSSSSDKIGGFIEWNAGAETYTTPGYTFKNYLGHFVLSPELRSSSGGLDNGVAFIDFNNGEASFSNESFKINEYGRIDMGPNIADAGIWHNGSDMNIDPAQLSPDALLHILASTYIHGNVTADYFIGDGSQLTGIDGMDYTNLALTNISNTFEENQTIDANLNVTGNIEHYGNITNPVNNSWGYFNNGTCIVIGDLNYVDEC